MDDTEKGDRQELREPIDAAATKLWTVYVSEAEKYDKALVESWRSDMNAMLIFAGLFSAILTAFLIESYQTLLPGPGDDTAFFLRQISGQLAASASGTNFTVSQPVPHVPTMTSLVCNILWFISLGLSLACALIATLLEQWAREFIHRSEMHSAPLIRARIFSFLYFGLRRFNMHIVVGVIPLLLHTSLILFFAGLVAFLVPVNTSVMAVVAVLLVIVIAIYSVLTLLPLKYLDSPYHTPLSAGLWNLVGSISRLLRLRDAFVTDGTGGPHMDTMVEAMSRKATTRSPERVTRDNRALVWAMSSLSDETELEPFVEGIADVLCGPSGRHHGYEQHIRHLLNTPEIRFRARIEDLLATCDTGLLPPVEKTRRQTACYRALWSIADMSIQGLHRDSVPCLPILFKRKTWIELCHEVDHYGASTWALMRSSAALALLPSLSVILADLLECQAEFRIYRLINFDHLLWHRSQLHANKLFDFFLDSTSLFSPRDDSTSTLRFLNQWIDDIREFTHSIGHAILFRYLWAAGQLDLPPYELDRTQLKIPVDVQKLSVSATWVLHAAIKTTISINLKKLNDSESSGDHWVDRIIGTLLSFYAPPLELLEVVHHFDLVDRIGQQDSFCEVAMYLGRRTSFAAVSGVLRRCGARKDICSMLLRCCTTPQDRLSYLFGSDGEAAAADSMTALWRICSLNPIAIMDNLSFCESVLDTLLSNEICPPRVASIKALLKCKILTLLSPGSYQCTSDLSQYAKLLRHPSLLVETSFEASEELLSQAHDNVPEGISNPLVEVLFNAVSGRINEARISLFGELLESCCSDEMPYNASQTISDIIILPSAGAHPVHQLRFARGLQSLFQFGPERRDLFEAAISSTLFRAYYSSEDPLWLDHAPARQTVKACLAAYATTLPEVAPGILAKIRKIVQNLDEKHAEVVEDGAETGVDSAVILQDVATS